MEQIKNIIATAVKQLYGMPIDIDLTRPDSKFGDFASNVAIKLAKDLKQNPQDVALAIANNIKTAKEISSVDVAGPGFINIRITDQLLNNLIKINIVKKANQKVVIETNNPNPFKSMHIGHAFNAIVADTIANLLDLSQAEVHRVSYHGDVGAHVGKSMYSLLRFVNGNAEKLDQISTNERNTFMSKMYAEGASAYKQNEIAKQEIDLLASQSFVKEDPLYKKVYETCITWSFQQIDELVAQLGNKPIEKRYLESQADELGVQTVKQHIGDVFFESDGAIVFPGEKYGSFNNVFVSSNGRGLYGARDIGLIQLKHIDFKPQKSFIVTAEEQRDYFKGVLKATELCLPELKGSTINISTGTVKLITGKMSSRSGDVLEVGWLFDQIVTALEQHGSGDNNDIIMATIRYQFLKVRIGSDIIFDIKESTNLQGNTGPYLQYSFARATSILRKASTKEKSSLVNLTKDERYFALKISEFTEVCNKAVAELAPHVICAYLHELTQSFNRFYEKNRVIGDQRESLRLKLLGLYTQTLKQGLDILGIPVLEKM